MEETIEIEEIRVEDVPVGKWFEHRGNLHIKIHPIQPVDGKNYLGELVPWESICIKSNNDYDWAGGPCRWNPDVKVRIFKT